MPRVIKHPDSRRKELLDLAFDLFLKRGNEDASLNDLIAASGLSKGAFYHYFPSKQALLESLADRIAAQRLPELQKAFASNTSDPLDHLNRSLARSAALKIQNAEITGQLFGSGFFFRPENHALFERITAAWEAAFLPLLTQAITDGVAKGRFSTKDAGGVAGMIQHLMSGTRSLVAQGVAAETDGDRRKAASRLEKQFELHGVAASRMLGLPDESVAIVPRGFATKFLAGFLTRPNKADAAARRA